MNDAELTTRDAQVIVDGGRPPGRGDLEDVVELAAFMRASTEVEPAPPMSVQLIWQLDGASLPQN